jgi:hypothetical protein
LPPAIVAGTAELMGPVQKPGGSAAGAVLAGGGVAVSAASADMGDAASIDATERIRARERINVIATVRIASGSNAARKRRAAA